MNNHLSSSQVCRTICEYEFIVIRAFLRNLGSPAEGSALEQFDRSQGFLEAERFVLACDQILSVAEKIYAEREQKAKSDDAGAAKSTCETSRI
jgi:hypothetical protein